MPVITQRAVQLPNASTRFEQAYDDVAYESDSSGASNGSNDSQQRQVKLQPWKLFVSMPPVLRDAEQLSGPIRLKAEKDDKGLGG
jgi:hypothetical protein